MLEEMKVCFFCKLFYGYEFGDGLYMCLECGFEWNLFEEEVVFDDMFVVKDSNGNVFQDGDIVIVVKDLLVKGVLKLVKLGIKVKNIWLVDGDYNIVCYIEGFGVMGLKLEFV